VYSLDLTTCNPADLPATCTFALLYPFSGFAHNGMPDGGQPRGGLIQTADGTLYGTTSYGGAHPFNSDYNLGVIFSLNPSDVDLRGRPRVYRTTVRLWWFPGLVLERPE
jgi:uncharacterized repeat protein (TIGR03803 family)